MRSRNPFTNQRGQVVLLTLAVLGSLTAIVIYMLAGYVTEIGRAHDKTRDSVLAFNMAEKLGVELRRYWDITVATDAPGAAPPTCVSSTMPGLAFDASANLCLPSAGPREICVEQPQQVAGANRRFCADFSSFHARNAPASGELFVDARFRWKPQALRLRVIDAWSAVVAAGLPNLGQIGFRQAQAQGAERSALFRPTLPKLGLPSHSLPPAAAQSRITCGTGPGNARCLTIRICDSRFACTSPGDFIFQRFAFP